MRHTMTIAATLSLLACTARPGTTSIPAASPGASALLEEHDYAAQEVVEPYVPYRARSASFRTRLEGPRPAVEPAEPPPSSAREIRYPSDVGALRAWYARPPSSRTAGKRLPVVVYLHNDFALRAEAWNNAHPFVDAGYALLVPGLRGEDGGPGERELLLGEVHDAKAAVAWARAQTDHAPECVSVLGHSIGGGVAALLALSADAGVRRTASVGGIYRAHTFHAWSERESIRGIVRFDVTDPREVSMRLLLPNLRDLAVPHIAYAGTDDDFDDRYAALAAERARAVGTPLEHVRVSGDHMSSITAAVTDFLARLGRDGSECAPAR